MEKLTHPGRDYTVVAYPSWLFLQLGYEHFWQNISIEYHVKLDNF